MEKKKIIKLIAENVRNLMNQKGFTNTELARRCKISPGTISKIINANMSITLPMAISLAQGLEVNIHELLKGLPGADITISGPKWVDSQTAQFRIGILSINNRRVTCIKDNTNTIVGISELEGGLDLIETSGNLIHLIYESVYAALPKESRTGQNNLKQTDIHLVMQSYEFEDKRHKFTHFAKKHFKNVIILSDWQITYLSTFSDKEGISLVVDKGVSLSYKHNNSLKKLGGWKFPVYDLGGENWLGLETIRHTIEAAEGYIPMSTLAHKVLAKFNGKIERITETCFTGADFDIYCLFADILLRSYFMHDSAAQAIVQKGFQLIYRSIERTDSIIGKALPIALNGSLTDIYKPFFPQERLVPPSSETQKAELLTDITKEFLDKIGQLFVTD